MVDEFSSFARMPQATLKIENLSEICHRAVFLERNRLEEIDYQVELPDDPIYLSCDSLQISQALTNLLKNAAESVSSCKEQRLGKIRCSLTQVVTNGLPLVSIAIHDNGAGLPEVGWEKHTEPYVTSREGGTGLGLAIVKKIMEDHSGKIVLTNNEDGGATINLLFHQKDNKEESETKQVTLNNVS
jgi:two-component system nitrogen regulation sensor histidine kinase NtrY